jgi:hypothetical protein
MAVEDSVGLLTISAVYLPPKHTVKKEQLEDFYNTPGRWFTEEETTMLSIPTRDPDSLLPEDANYSKRRKETT